MNGRKHGVSGGGLDPCSSAMWFEPWRRDGAGPAPVVRALSWLLSVGWRRAGTIEREATPAKGRASRMVDGPS
jgi:hypothetical protein